MSSAGGSNRSARRACGVSWLMGFAIAAGYEGGLDRG